MRIVKTIPEPKDLPPGSLPWSRAMVQAVGDVENRMASSATEQDAAMKGIAATLDALSRQVSDLQERAVRVGESGYNSGQVPYNSALPWSSGLVSGVDFSLKTRRNVMIGILWNYVIDFSYNGSSPAFFSTIDMHFDLMLNGTRWTYRSIQAFTQQAVVGEGSHLIETGSMSFWDVIPLEPGSYEAATNVEVLSAVSSDGDWTVNNPKVLVQVMDAWE